MPVSSIMHVAELFWEYLPCSLYLLLHPTRAEVKALSPNRTEHKEVPLRNGREDDGLTESARVLLAEDWLDLKFLG